jgi:hypothetical protein
MLAETRRCVVCGGRFLGRFCRNDTLRWNLLKFELLRHRPLISFNFTGCTPSARRVRPKWACKCFVACCSNITAHLLSFCRLTSRLTRSLNRTNVLRVSTPVNAEIKKHNFYDTTCMNKIRCLSHRLADKAYWKAIACLRLKNKGVSLVASFDFALEIRYALLVGLSGRLCCQYSIPVRSDLVSH